MHILGFDCYGHDAAAAIVRDGEMLGLVEEERFLRKKHVADFPRNAIRWCCEVAGITPQELDHIVYYWNPRLSRGRGSPTCSATFLGASAWSGAVPTRRPRCSVSVRC